MTFDLIKAIFLGIVEGLTEFIPVSSTGHLLLVQRFFGFRSLSLSNGWSDPALVRDKLGTDIFREAGLDVPATAFYRVFVDHGTGPIYFGL